MSQSQAEAGLTVRLCVSHELLKWLQEFICKVNTIIPAVQEGSMI